MIIKNGQVALPGLAKPEINDIKVENGKIAAIAPNIISEGDIIDADGLLVLPGGIDPHVHFNDPGYVHREDFYTGTAFAASGGITTVIDMPCTSIPPVTNRANFDVKYQAIKDKAVIDYCLFGGISAQSFESGFPGNMEELAECVVGFKTYFLSGMESFGSLNKSQFEDVLEAARVLKRPVLLHAEDKAFVEAATIEAKKSGNEPKDFYNSRPEKAEILAVSKAVRIAERVGAELHIVHIGTADAAELVPGGKITCETAPHYLEFDTEDFTRIGSPLKVTPPVKSPENKSKLWKFLANGKISFVASDHAPCTKEEKNTGSIWTDYSGIPGTGTIFPYILSEGYFKKRLSLKKFIEVTSSNAARRYGIFDRKGSIEVGKDADFVLIDPNRSWVVEGDKFLSKGKITPFERMELKGKIIKTILRGEIIYDTKRGITLKNGFGKLLFSKYN